MFSYPCEHCGADLDQHDYEHRARECYPKQIESLEARLKEAGAYTLSERWNQQRAETERLRSALAGIAEYCSTDGSPLGATAGRLAAIRNTAEQALRTSNEQLTERTGK